MTDVAAAAPSSAVAPVPQARSAWHNASGFGFHDILDIINPLQHLPIISSVYRWLTGDRPGAVAQIAGDALYGGPIGAAVGFVSTALEDNSGRDMGERVLTAVFGDKSSTAVAAAQTSPSAGATTTAAAAPAVPSAPGEVASNGTMPGAAAPLPQARPDHAPIPLFGGIAQPPPAPGATAATPTPSQQFLAQTTGAIRPAVVAARPATGFQPTKPVPLALPAGALPASAATTVPAPPNPNTPINISQKMLDALDKYQRLEKERESSKQKSTTTPAVDLAL
jgi:hypothetical protein